MSSIFTVRPQTWSPVPDKVVSDPLLTNSYINKSKDDLDGFDYSTWEVFNSIYELGLGGYSASKVRIKAIIL